MKNNPNNLTTKYAKTQIHKSSVIQGDVMIGEQSVIGKNSVINCAQKTIILGSNVRIYENVLISSHGKYGNTFICNNVEIQDKVQICNSTIEDDVKIEQESVIMDNCYIARGAKIGIRTIITPNSRIMDNQVCEPNSIYSGNPAIKIASLDLKAYNIKNVFRSPMFSNTF